MVTSIHETIQTRYNLEDCHSSKQYISTAISKLEPMIENISIKHPSGIYRGKYYNIKYFFFQDRKQDPPTFISTRNNHHEWDLINAVDQNKLETYIERI